MSNLRVNIRILWYHIQITDGWKLKISNNDYHHKLKHGWFAVYQFDLFKKISSRDAPGK